MASSIGDVNVRIVADAGSVGPAVAQAQRSFRQFEQTASGGMRQVQGVAQQAVFAVDDFFTSFQTGGVAGGLRGAANNLTMIASMLGGVKTQLVAIAAVTAAGFLAKYFFDASKAIKESSDALSAFQEQLKRGSAVGSREQSQREKIRDALSVRSLPEAFRERSGGATRLSDLQEQLAAENKRIGDLRQVIASVIGDEATKAAKDELSERQNVARALREQIREQMQLNKAIDNNLRVLQQQRMWRPDIGAAGGVGGRLRRDAAMAVIDEQIAELHQSLIPSFSVGELFNRFPSAHQMGSGGAVGTINSAQFGPQNMQATLVREAQETNRVLKRIEELEKKKDRLEEVSL